MDLSVEPAFATLTHNMEQSAKLAPNTKVKLLFAKQKAQLDRRWPAVLFKYGIKLRQNQCDVYEEAFYTAAVWRAVSCAVSKSRLIPEVRRVKAAYCIDGGPVFYSAEAALASVKQDLLHQRDTYGDPVVITTTPVYLNDLFLSVESAHCDVRGLPYPTTPKAHLILVQICDRLALEENLANSDRPYFKFYTVDSSIRCQMAVDISHAGQVF